MKPKLQLGGEKESGNTSARSSAQTMQQETTNPHEITKKTRSSHSSRAPMTFLFLLVVPNADQSTSFTS